MRRRARPTAAPLLALVLGLVSLACSAPPEASPPPSPARATGAEAPSPPAPSEPVLRLGATFPPSKSPMFDPPRLIEVAAACSGPALRLEADLAACRCGEPGVLFEPDGRVQHTAGKSCGLPHADERGPAPRLTLQADSPAVAPGEVARVTATLVNDGPGARRYRVHDTRIGARFVQVDGTALPHHGDAGSWDGSYREEALFALPAGGKAVLVLEAEASTWKSQGGSTARAPLPPGKYAIEVRLSSLGGTRLVPVEVR